MMWTEVIITTSQEQKFLLQDISVTFADGFALEDYCDLEQTVQFMTHIQCIDDELLSRPRDIVKMHIYYSPDENIAQILDKIHAVLLATNIKYSLEIKNIQQQDWENAWKTYYHPFEVGDRLAVVPSWEKYETSRTIITLDPGMAFGTGTHETTFMCLEYIDKFIKGGERVLDIGTGSGILGVGALLLGAKTALGIDIDPLCVRTAKENAKINNVQDQFDVRLGNLADQAKGKFNIITANIIADAIVSLAPAIPPMLTRGGKFIASGIIADRAQEVVLALEKTGLVITEMKDQKEWCAILCAT